MNNDQINAIYKEVTGQHLRPQDERLAYAFAKAMLVAVPAQAGTPAAAWRAKGEPDPHGDRYNCERAALGMGKLTDDELANGVFMNYDQPLNIHGILDGMHSSPIAWVTSAQDRIRWLSRKLTEALAVPAQGQCPEGFKLVPVNPTPGMIREGNDASAWHVRDADDIYLAMLAAAPAAPAVAASQDAIDAGLPLDFSRPLETLSGKPVKYICSDVIEHECARVCVDQATGMVYSSPYRGLKIRNAAPAEAELEPCTVGNSMLMLPPDICTQVNAALIAIPEISVDALREAVIEAADEWSGYVEMDSAPRTCGAHIAMAFDAARANQEKAK